jgi:predicted nucleic acid-binding protein
MIVVADSGPIHYLVLIDDIDVLQPLFTRVLIPEAVRAEIMRPRTPPSVHAWIAHPPAWAEILSVRRSDEKDLARLGPGEHEAIVLARQTKVDYLLIDDARGRLFAESQHIPTIGTIGILREAAARNLINFMSSFHKLMATNFRISSLFREQLLKEFDTK